MSDYLTNLAARSLNRLSVIRPRLASLFEPPPSGIPIPSPGFPTESESRRDIVRETPDPTSARPLPSPVPAEVPIPVRREVAKPRPGKPAEAPEIRVDGSSPRRQSPPPIALHTPVVRAAKSIAHDPRPVRAPRDERVHWEPRVPAPSPVPRAVAAKTIIVVRPEVAVASDHAGASAAAARAEPAALESMASNRPRGSPPPTPPAATVQITIGRIKVRALPPAAPAVRPPRAKSMSLDEYLQRRGRGGPP